MRWLHVVPHFGPHGCSVTEKLDYLKELGINAIRFAPAMPLPPRVVSYNVSGYSNFAQTTAPRLSLPNWLQRHRRGIRVLMDGSRTTPP